MDTDDTQGLALGLLTTNQGGGGGERPSWSRLATERNSQASSFLAISTCTDIMSTMSI